MALVWDDVCEPASVPGVCRQHTGDRLWQIFGPLIEAHQSDQAFVIAQLGQSLDGRIATRSGHSHYINGQGALDHLHRLRALVDGVVAGAGTIVTDNPALTVRRVKGTSPARIVIDPNRRVDMSSRVFADDGTAVIIVGPAVPGDSSHFQYVPPNTDGAYPPTWIAGQLCALGCKRLLIEGGATTVSRFIADRAINRLHILTGPIIIGSGPAGISLPEIGNLRDAIRPETKTYPFGDGDVLFDCKFERETE